jgi:hypothetical protein
MLQPPAKNDDVRPRTVGAHQHTIFAGQALGLTALFQVGFGKKRLEGPVSYTPELSAPDGESTGGGKQALQHVKLVPDSGATLVIGTANVVDKSCELRTFRHMDEVHRQRFKGRPFEADPAKYDQLIEELRGFFTGQHFTVSMHEAAAPARPLPSVATASRPVATPAVAKLPSKTPVGLYVTIATTVALAATIAVILLRR